MMRINEWMKYLPKSDKLTQFFLRIAGSYAAFCSKLTLLIARITDSKPFQLFIEYKRYIALSLYLIWLIGCGYWLYQLMIIDVKPGANLGLILTDSRDALVILFFGAIGSIFLIFFVFFIIKLIYNLFHDGIESHIPEQWHSLVKPVCYLVILYVAFPFTGTFKVAGMTTYNQVAELIHTSRHQDIIIEKAVTDDLEAKLNKLLKLVEKNKQE
ncbi:MAG: hypothetical protein HY757_01615 [Nitrospirae bacterium]|nr:hypothetical protein [Nitrospirota bacterium]